MEQCFSMQFRNGATSGCAVGLLPSGNAIASRLAGRSLNLTLLFRGAYSVTAYALRQKAPAAHNSLSLALRLHFAPLCGPSPKMLARALAMYRTGAFRGC